MYGAFKDHLRAELDGIAEAGLTKNERGILGPQGPEIAVGESRVLNFCANNYLGLADDPSILAAAHEALDEWGYGLASVRFICGTQEQHLELERRLSGFLGTEETILFSSCFDANGGVFETLFSAEDAIISDALNHASIIDGIRLSKARRLRYANRDMAELEQRLVEAADARFRVIVTDGVFSMDGYIAPLEEICDLAERYDALVLVDDSHAVGFLGEGGRGTPNCAVWPIASTFSPAHSARRSAGPRVATSRVGARSSICFASALGPTCSRTRSRPRSWRARSPLSIWSSRRATRASGCARTPRYSGRSWLLKGSICCRESTRSFP